jgi:hypothetical protein
MPVWKSSRGNIYFKFDPGVVARLLSRGEKVLADRGLPPEEFEVHNSLIDEHLRKLWGENEVGKTIEKVEPHALPSQPFSSERFWPLEHDPSLPFRQMVPNPLNKGVIEKLERPRKPNLLEAGLNFDPNKMTWDDLMDLRRRFTG